MSIRVAILSLHCNPLIRLFDRIQKSKVDFQVFETGSKEEWEQNQSRIQDFNPQILAQLNYNGLGVGSSHHQEIIAMLNESNKPLLNIFFDSPLVTGHHSLLRERIKDWEPPRSTFVCMNSDARNLFSKKPRFFELNPFILEDEHLDVLPIDPEFKAYLFSKPNILFNRELKDCLLIDESMAADLVEFMADFTCQRFPNDQNLQIRIRSKIQEVFAHLLSVLRTTKDDMNWQALLQVFDEMLVRFDKLVSHIGVPEMVVAGHIPWLPIKARRLIKRQYRLVDGIISSKPYLYQYMMTSPSHMIHIDARDWESTRRAQLLIHRPIEAFSFTHSAEILKQVARGHLLAYDRGDLSIHGVFEDLGLDFENEEELASIIKRTRSADLKTKRNQIQQRLKERGSIDSSANRLLEIIEATIAS